MTVEPKRAKFHRGRVYDIITDRIIAELEKGTAPWRMTWKTKMPPMNLASKRGYRGINVLILSLALFSSPYFATIKQVNQLGGRVKKGEKGLPVVFWKFKEADPDTAPLANGDVIKKNSNAPIIRYYTVFNVEQCEGLEGCIPTEETILFDPIDDTPHSVWRMLIQMDETQIGTLEGVEQFLFGTGQAHPVLQGGKENIYAWIERTLVRFHYIQLNRKGKGIVRRYIMQLSGY